MKGSSAGAGSGEFHVYRHLRRKEYARLRHIETQAKQVYKTFDHFLFNKSIVDLQEELDYEYRQRLEENKRKAEEKTAKKRAKRLKKKEKMKTKKQSSGNLSFI